MFSEFSGGLSPLITVWLQVRVLPGPPMNQAFLQSLPDRIIVPPQLPPQIRVPFRSRLDLLIRDEKRFSSSASEAPP
jgi:hypothetical protein